MEINSKALQVAPLNLREMRGLALMAKQLLTHFIPDKYTYICLGNSPALIIELIAQSKIRPTIVYLPISDIEGLEVAPREKGRPLYEKLLGYVDRVIGNQVKTSHVLLVDMTSTGAALGSIKVLLDDYYERKHELKIVEMVSLNVMSAKPSEELQHLPLNQIRSLPSDSPDSQLVAQKIVECRYKNDLLLQMFAKHPIIDIQLGKLEAPALQGPHYQRMREMVKGIIRILKHNGEALDLFA
jgi:hypothetical protein